MKVYEADLDLTGDWPGADYEGLVIYLDALQDMTEQAVADLAKSGCKRVRITLIVDEVKG